MYKVAIIGSRSFSESKELMTRLRNKISLTVQTLYKKYGNDFCIVSGGQFKGADGEAKRIALKLGVNYKEFPPAHYKFNEHCVKDESNYGKPYHVSNFFIRNKEIIDFSDIIIAFIPKEIELKESRGTYDAVAKARNIKKEIRMVKI